MASGTSSCSPRKRTCSALFAAPPVPTEVILEAQSYSNKILNGLELLRESGDLCDYTLIAEGNEFKVRSENKILVCVCLCVCVCV